MAVRTYSPREIVLSIGGTIITGYAPDSFLNVTPAVDTFSKSVGGAGEVSRALNPDFTGNITLTLQQTSPDNEALTALHQIDRITLDGTLPLLLKDNNGNTLISSENAWVSKLPDAGYGTEVGVREWSIQMSDMNALYGSNNNS